MWNDAEGLLLWAGKDDLCSALAIACLALSAVSRVFHACYVFELIAELHAVCCLPPLQLLSQVMGSVPNTSSVRLLDSPLRAACFTLLCCCLCFRVLSANCSACLVMHADRTVCCVLHAAPAAAVPGHGQHTQHLISAAGQRISAGRRRSQADCCAAAVRQPADTAAASGGLL